MFSPGLPVTAAHRPGDAGKEKHAVTCVPTRDGRLHISFQLAATLTRAKLYFLGSLFLLVVIASLRAGMGFGESRVERVLRERVGNLEGALGRKVSWLAQHAPHLNAHVSGGVAQWTPRVHADGRKHLLSDPDGPSRLAEAIAPATALADVDDHYLCGENTAVTEAEVVRKKIAIGAC